MPSGTVLYVGGGASKLPIWYEGCTGVMLDIDPKLEPDILADMCDMGDIGQFDHVLSIHSLEHLYPDDVPKALKEFYRVLKPGGTVLIFVPDLEGVSATNEVLYESLGGPISGLDLIYGGRQLVAYSRYMAHHTGFMSDTLQAAMEAAGFQNVVTQRLSCHNLLGAAKK